MRPRDRWRQTPARPRPLRQPRPHGRMSSALGARSQWPSRSLVPCERMACAAQAARSSPPPPIQTGRRLSFGSTCPPQRCLFRIVSHVSPPLESPLQSPADSFEASSTFRSVFYQPHPSDPVSLRYRRVCEKPRPIQSTSSSESRIRVSQRQYWHRHGTLRPVHHTPCTG